MELTVGGEIYVLNAGDRDFLEADTWQTARVASEEYVVYLIGEIKERLIKLTDSFSQTD